MRIFFLVSSFGAGGAERVATTLCNAWVRRGDSVTLVPTYSGGGEPFYTLDERVELIYLSQLAGLAQGKRKRYFRRLQLLRKLIGDRKPDIVISFLPNVNIAALVATAFSGVPCIVCERSDPTMVPMGRFWREACRLFYRTADRVTVQTEVVAEKIKQIYGGLREVAVLPNPLPEMLPLHSADRVVKDRRTLLSMGRLSEEKRVDLIIDSFALVAARFPEWDLHIYGDGPLRQDLAAQIERLDLHERIRLMGRTDEPWRIMSAADAFVLASRYEGFPNALLEAMGVGLACVVTDCPSGPREITRDGADARLVAVDNGAGLQAAIAELMGNDELRHELGQRARDSVSSRYSLDAVLNQWDAVFRGVGVLV